MTDDTLEKAIENAEKLWNSTAQKPENKNWWGMYSYGDAPPAIGGGVGSFVWFSNRDELLHFLETALPYSPPGSSSADWPEVSQKTRSIVGRMRANEIDDGTACEQLNAALRSFSQIEWVGTYEDLVCGDHSYAQKVRQEFWDENGSSSSKADAIPDNEIEAFSEFISMWGV